MTTETRSLLDQIAEARRERDAAAVVVADQCWRNGNTANCDAEFLITYRSKRSRLAALEAKLKEQENKQ